ncbi:MAG: hypothetical protein PF689_03625 [Deltaproteobacteria bacterium]|nr:hypothetical protein [Deltaproteobacteria bacterium]
MSFKKCSRLAGITMDPHKVNVIGIVTTWSLKSQLLIKRFNKTRSFFEKRVHFHLVFVDKTAAMYETWLDTYKPVLSTYHIPKWKLCGKTVVRVPGFVIINSSGKICYGGSGLVTSNFLYHKIKECL